MKYSRVVGNDNCVSFRRMKLQIPSDPQRFHYVKAKVRGHAYPDGKFAVFHGPRKLGSYNAKGELLEDGSIRTVARRLAFRPSQST